jgi:hypothetical protein
MAFGEAMTHVKVGKWSTVCAVFLSGALVSAAPASADQMDDAFVAALPQAGITMSDPGTAIGMARTMCAGLDSNQTVPVLALQVMRDTNFSPRQAGFFIGLSVAAYCPRYMGQTDTSMDWLLPPPPPM